MHTAQTFDGGESAYLSPIFIYTLHKPSFQTENFKQSEYTGSRIRRQSQNKIHFQNI
jgi:hypothetical protein